MSRMKAVLARITPRHVLIVTGVAILTLVMTITLRNAVRELVVVPVSALAWAAGILINSVPQAAWLGVLVLVGAIIAVRSLSLGTGAKPQDVTFVETQTVAPTRLAFWVGRLSNAQRGSYTAERALSEMRSLVVDCIAHEQRVPVEDVIDLARKDLLDVPTEVRTVLLENHEAQSEGASPLQDLLDALSSLFARLTGRTVMHNTSMTPEFQHKVNVMLNYVEAMNK